MIVLLLAFAATASPVGCPTHSGTLATIAAASTDTVIRVTVDAGALFAGATAVVHAAACVPLAPGASGMQMIRTEPSVAQCYGAHGLACPAGVGWPLAAPTWRFVELDSLGRATVALPSAASFYPTSYQASAHVVDSVAGIATSTGSVSLDPVCPYAPGSFDFCYFCGPCGAGEGECRGQDGLCESGLRCSRDVGRHFGLSATVDVCLDPADPGFCPVPLGAVDRCWECGLCGAGEGNCSGDLECFGGALGDMECKHEPSLGWSTCQVVTP